MKAIEEMDARDLWLAFHRAENRGELLRIEEHILALLELGQLSKQLFDSLDWAMDHIDRGSANEVGTEDNTKFHEAVDVIWKARAALEGR